MTGMTAHAGPVAGHATERSGIGVLALLPRNICVALLDGYRATISPLYGDVCKYYPSCSRYTLTAIQEHGAIRGIWLGAKRLVRCHPWAKGGIDDVPAAARGHAITGRGGFVHRIEAHDDCGHEHVVARETRVNTNA